MVLAAFPGQVSLWKLLGEPGTYEPASLLWTKPVLGRKRREPEAFLDEMAAELDCRCGEERVWGRRPGDRKGQGPGGRVVRWPASGPSALPVVGGCAELAGPGEVAALSSSW